MRHFDADDAKELNAEQWQLDLLDLNPDYVSWGPHEDYMWTKDSKGWNSSQIVATWPEFGPWELNELNERVNFYFSVNRESKECETCGGNGHHPQAQAVVNSFYKHMNAEGIEWCNKITQDEFEALQREGRSRSFKTVEECNAANTHGATYGGFEAHDAINRWILTTARLKRLGLPETCPTCEGRGYVHTASTAHVSLTLWWLHPRKGCSRGLEVTRVEQSELPAVFALLRAAADRNAQRFSKVTSTEHGGAV